MFVQSVSRSREFSKFQKVFRVSRIQQLIKVWILQVPFCEEKSVQLVRLAFFRSDFLQNPYFSNKKCSLNLGSMLFRRKGFYEVRRGQCRGQIEMPSLF